MSVVNAPAIDRLGQPGVLCCLTIFIRRQRPHRHRAETLIVSSGMVADDPGMGELHDSRLNDTLA
jgi:hypothetical protein